MLTDLATAPTVDWIALETGAAATDRPAAPDAGRIPEIRLHGGCEFDVLGHFLRLSACKVVAETNFPREHLLIRRDSSVNLLHGLGAPDPAMAAQVAGLGIRADDLRTGFFDPVEPGSVLIFSGWADLSPQHYRHREAGFVIQANLRRAPFGDLTATAEEERESAAFLERFEPGFRQQSLDFLRTLGRDYRHEGAPGERLTEASLRRLFDAVPEGARLFVLLPITFHSIEAGRVHPGAVRYCGIAP